MRRALRPLDKTYNKSLFYICLFVLKFVNNALMRDFMGFPQVPVEKAFKIWVFTNRKLG